MTTKIKRQQALIRLYKQATGKTEIDMHDVARYAIGKGYNPPKPRSPIDLLAKEFSQAAREEYRRDPQTGRTYRANLAFSVKQGTEQLTLWIDTDEAPRKSMIKSLTQYREQMVGEAMHMVAVADRWNSIHPNEEPIQMELDLGPDIEWRKNAPLDDVG